MTQSDAPNEPQWKKDGWKHDPEYLSGIKRDLLNTHNIDVDLETIDEVLSYKEQPDAPNEGREEKLEELMSENERLRQAYQYIHASRNSVDKELNEAQKENDSLRDQLSKEQFELKSAKVVIQRRDIQIQQLEGQLSKEREKVKRMDEELTTEFERGYNIGKNEEREMRKELVDCVDLLV